MPKGTPRQGANSPKKGSSQEWRISKTPLVLTAFTRTPFMNTQTPLTTPALKRISDSRSKRHRHRLSVFACLPILALMLGEVKGQAPVTGDWNVNANGNWTDTTRWVDGVVPNGVGYIADIVHNISSTRTITLDIAITLGTLRLGDTNADDAFILTGETLTFDNGGAGAILDHGIGSVTGGPAQNPNASDRLNMMVDLNDDLTIYADANISFYNTWDAQGHDITINGNARVYFDGNGTADFGNVVNAGTITVNSGELRIEGQVGAKENYVGADLISLGTGTPMTGNNSFTRLYLVNTEATQDFDLNMNGYAWFINDMGENDQTFTGNINLTGNFNTNLMDVNDPSTTASVLYEQHIFTGVISGTGGFTKINTGAMVLTNNNTFEGVMQIERGRSENLGSVHLSGADGAVSGTSGIILSRDGSLYLDNSSAVNNNRINDTASITMRDYGQLRIIGNDSAAVSETMGALVIGSGTNRISFDLADSTPQSVSLTFDSFQRNAGAIAQFQVVDSAPGALGTTAQVHIADGGASAVQYGGGGGNGSTNQTILVGAVGGNAAIPDHFMTFDENNPTLLRPLDFDTEYLLSQNLVDNGIAHTLNRDTIQGTDHNLMINYNTEDPNNPDPQVDWYGVRPIRVTESIAINSLRFGTRTPTVGLNTNELGSTVVLDRNAVIYLGDKAAGDGLPEVTGSGSGMILFGRDSAGNAAGSNQFIVGGALDFGSREAIFINESGNSAYIRSEIRGSGGLTKTGAQSVFLDNANTYTGTTTVAEQYLVVRHSQGLGGSNRVDVVGNGALYLELGSEMSADTDLYIMNRSESDVALRSNSSHNSWNGDIIMDNTSAIGQQLYSARIQIGTHDSLSLNGNIYGANLSNPLTADLNLNDAALISTESSGAGIININGVFQDNINGAASDLSGTGENQVLRFQVTGNNQLIVNVGQQWNAAGRILHEQGYLRYTGEGNFWTDEAAAAIVPTNAMSGMRLGGSSSGDLADINVVLTKEGQKLNIDRIDFGGSGSSDNYNNFGNIVLAGTNTSGTVTFGNGTGIMYYGSTDASRSYTRDLAVFSALGGTVNMDFRLDDNDSEVHTVFTKIGGGIVNLRGDNTATNGDVENVNLAGGLLRLTNYGSSTGTRFDNGAMVVFAGGSLEMDGVGSTTNITENFTGTAVGGAATFPVSSAATVIAAGSSNVVVTSDTGRTTTLNLGSSTINLNRESGGTLNFVENSNGGTSVITLNGVGAPAADSAIAWATYGDSFNSATQTANALDFAMVDSSGAVSAFTGSSREDTDDASAWTAGADVSEGAGGFSGTTSAGAEVNTLHFDHDGSSTLTLDAGGLTVDSGGIMISSAVASDSSTKSIMGGDLRAGSGQDLIIHQYGAGALTIDSNIIENGGTALVKTGRGELILTGTNTYTGGTFLNGGIITVSSDDQLGAVPGATEAGNLRFNGGTLNTTANMTLDSDRGIMIGGNGGGLSVAEGTTLSYGGIITSEANLIEEYVTAQATGSFVKSGAGTLVLTGTDNHTFTGILDIREGTILWENTAAGSTTADIFGSHNEFMDGTILRSGATLEFAGGTASTSSNSTTTIYEWFTLEAGSTINASLVSNSTTPRDRTYTFNGVIHLDAMGNAGTAAGTVLFNTARRGINFNNDGGYLTGDGGIQKIGDGALYFRENSPEWTGQLIINEGTVQAYSAGNVFGTGTLPILLGHDGNAVGETNGGNNEAGIYMRNESGFNNLPTITHDIIVRNENGLGSQEKRIGGYYLAHEDVAQYNGNLTLNDDVRFFYQDDVRNSLDTSNNSSHFRNDTRSYGAPENSETIFINFNGGINGDGNIITYVGQGGTGNATNGSITGANDDLVIHTIFGLNGDNRDWTGKLIISNNGGTTAADDVDRFAYIRLGHEFALNDNQVEFANRGYLQMGGIDKTFSQNFLFIGGTGLANTAKIQNADESDVTITFFSGAGTVNEVYQDIGVGMEDGVVYGGRYEDRGLLNVVKSGAGHTVFGASTGGGEIADSFSSYSGTTTVQEGILYAGSNNAFSPNSRFIVEAGAELSLYWDQASTGFDNTLGSLSGSSGALVDIDNSILRLGGDGTIGADYSGTISGYGSFYKIGTGSQRLSGDNTFFASNVAILEGTLIGGSNSAFGDDYNVINLGGVPLAAPSPIDARVELLLDGSATAVNNIVSMNPFDGNTQGITLIGTRATAGTYGFSNLSSVDAGNNIFAIAEGDSTFQFGGNVVIYDYGMGASLIKLGSGTVEMHGTSNYYGTGFNTSGQAIDGGTVLRQGTLSVFNSTALSTTVVELGDTRRVLSQGVYLATSGSLVTRGGEFDAESNGAGAAGAGAFLDVTSQVDGVTLTEADVGKRILVKDELGDPERNGIYEILSVDEADGSMILVRADDFDEAGEMLYGSSVEVAAGEQAGLSYFMASADVEAVNADDQSSPVYWEKEDASSDLALVAGVADLTILNDVDVNDTNSGGISALGGIFTSGNSTFTGNITLQHQDGVDNIHEITLTSASNTESGTGERGTIFTGVLSEAQLGDTLHVRVDGGGTVTLTNDSHSYTGKTTVGEDSTLLLHGAASISNSNWLEVEAGGVFETTQLTSSSAYTWENTVSGTGSIRPGAGNAFIVDGDGVIRPGLSSSPYNIATAGDQIGRLTVEGNLVLAGDSSGTDRLLLQMGATGGADFNDAINFSNNQGAGFGSWLQTQATLYDSFTGGNHDSLTITGNLSLDEGGYIVFNNSNGDYVPQYGDVFNLLDWDSLTENDFDTGGTQRGGGLLGDLYLPDLNTGFYDTSLFLSHGIIVVVPEPGRAGLLLGAGLIFMLRRRRPATR
ncbi:putative secreted protein with PEP-CTERM sorting signal [Prosthecobacter fusiformis]|uniref:Putative secreted protein with PEP-CTERM sorting signal n=1 Tax=Prosthecobacter fusiformis TaxID=48464 RepID=A0A4R7SQR9_9BACT|nr:PEP-CTERM sorting domain-containing protein [Prosthecobacter fusiformis]TDU80756.1 putative secreted protein with PEP-CTERM sorting signal [Prosthecobacter fusiformis]